MKYVQLDLNNIVVSEIFSNETIEGALLVSKEYEYAMLIGKKWNGSTFEDAPTEEVEFPETTEVTNADLLEVLLAIGEKVGA